MQRYLTSVILRIDCLCPCQKIVDWIVFPTKAGLVKRCLSLIITLVDINLMVLKIRQSERVVAVSSLVHRSVSYLVPGAQICSIFMKQDHDVTRLAAEVAGQVEWSILVNTSWILVDPVSDNSFRFSSRLFLIQFSDMAITFGLSTLFDVCFEVVLYDALKKFLVVNDYTLVNQGCVAVFRVGEIWHLQNFLWVHLLYQLEGWLWVWLDDSKQILHFLSWGVH